MQEDEGRELAPLSSLPGSPPVFPSWAVLTSGFFIPSGCGTILSKPCDSQLSTRFPVLRGERRAQGAHPALSCPPASPPASLGTHHSSVPVSGSPSETSSSGSKGVISAKTALLWAWGICAAGTFRSPHQPAQGNNSAGSTNQGGGMRESQDAANYKLPALLTQTVVVIPKDLDLCLKSQTNCLKTRQPRGGSSH